jgi:hypothetical protein
MIKRTLKRRVIIRENDFYKIKLEAFSPVFFLEKVDCLYDRAEWTPLTKDSIEKEIIIKGLKGEQMPRGGSWLVPEDYLIYLRDSLYNERYCKWNPRYDEYGYLVVQPRKNIKPMKLGWGIFEKDLESRI